MTQRGDRMHIASLREIATAAITAVPVGIRRIGPGSKPHAVQVRAARLLFLENSSASAATSYLRN